MESNHPSFTLLRESSKCSLLRLQTGVDARFARRARVCSSSTPPRRFNEANLNSHKLSNA